MDRRKTVALSSTLVLVTTATAVALNIGVLRLTRADTDASPVDATGDAEVTTVVVDVPPEATTTTAAPKPLMVVDSAGGAPPQPPAPPAPAPAGAPTPARPAPGSTRSSAAAPPTTTTVPAATTVPTTTAAPVTTEYLSFGAGAAGEVVIANHGDTLEFWAAYPPEGWQYQVENPIGREVTVKYRTASGGEAQLTAKLDDGKVSVEAEGLGGGEEDD